jgi:hypothetical protein
MIFQVLQGGADPGYACLDRPPLTRPEASNRAGSLARCAVRGFVSPVLSCPPHRRGATVAARTVVVLHNTKIGRPGRPTYSPRVWPAGIYARCDGVVTDRWNGMKGGAVGGTHHRSDHRARLAVAAV